MICPNCKKEMEFVSLTSHCVQSVRIDANGNFKTFDSPDVQDSILANCQNCYEEFELGSGGMSIILHEMEEELKIREDDEGQCCDCLHDFDDCTCIDE